MSLPGYFNTFVMVTNRIEDGVDIGIGLEEQTKYACHVVVLLLNARMSGVEL